MTTWAQSRKSWKEDRNGPIAYMPYSVPYSAPGRMDHLTINFGPALNDVDVPEDGFRAGAALGWRLWRVDPSGVLSSLYVWEPWPGGEELVARCRLHNHEAPYPGCNCGVYGSDDASQLDRIADILHADYAGCRVDPLLAIGQVSLWGRYRRHEHGWRCQYGYPKRLFLPAAAWSGTHEQAQLVVNGLRHRYGVRVNAYKDLRRELGISYRGTPWQKKRENDPRRRLAWR